jgi:thioesterase domain-containing protein
MAEQDVLARLAATWHGEIPITAAMDLAPVAFADHRLTVAATLAPNVNVHGTAFAGSLYAIAALSGWGLVHLELEAAGLDGSIVIADGRIAYQRPVQEEIRAVCATDAQDVEATLTRLREAGRTRWPLTAVIHAAGREAVRFEGSYAIKLRDR